MSTERSPYVAATTITPHYLEQQRLLHQNPAYGVASLAFAPLVALIVANKGFRVISDYGAGKKRLYSALVDHGVDLDAYQPYDPVFPEYGKPMPAPLVCCIDVLEHVEPECLDAVLAELSSVTIETGFFTIHTGPAVKTLADGRNAHLIQKGSSWWLPRLCEYFEILHLESHQTMGSGFWTLVAPRR